ncbi:VOC family protein [Streptomyces sp. NPDC097610]|uniref:VOC family protein n=1 Tax=unclassified Streptomyces TaxID=2593676 RepID=UPI0033207F7C
MQLNHTIYKARDKYATARFLTDVVGLPEAESFAKDRFLIHHLDNNVSVDVGQVDEPFDPEHYAFLVTEAEFDEILARVQERGIDYYPDPFYDVPGSINYNDGGRGMYFRDPSGHDLEVMTTPYGEDSASVGRVHTMNNPG